MKSMIFSLLGVVMLSAVMAGSVASSESPTAVVMQGVGDVIAVLRDESLDLDLRREKMRGLIGQRFDFQAMSQSILARNWKKASPEEKERFVALFKQLLENTYIAAIESYTSEEIVFGSEKISGRKATVGVKIVLKSGSEAPLTFKLKNRGEQWYVYDVIIEGVSLVSNYRSSFRSTVHKTGISGLLDQMEQKLNRS